MVYLGLTLGAYFKARHIWNDIFWKNGEITGWLEKIIPFLGGTSHTHQEYTIELPIYFMSLFNAPINVANKLEKFQQDFMWGGLGGREENSSCRLDLATIPVEAGRLGIRKLNNFKCELFTNCPWHFNQEWGHLWRRLVGKKYDKLVGSWTLQLVKHSLWLWSLKGRQLEQDGFFH